MYKAAAVRELYKDIIKGTLSVYDSVIAWCADVEGINFLSFTLTANNLDIAMKQAAGWQEKFSNIRKDADLVYLEEQIVQKGQLADSLLGKIGDDRNYTLHKNGDNEAAKDVIRKAMLELDSKLRAYGKT
jgi:hypothetical protein